jgi:hypothetical protein
VIFLVDLIFKLSFSKPLLKQTNKQAITTEEKMRRTTVNWAENSLGLRNMLASIWSLVALSSV